MKHLLLSPICMPKTKYCISCKTVKHETPENFQRRGDTFRSPCKACMKKIKNRKKPEKLVPIKTPDNTRVLVEPEDPIVDIGFALNAITARHNRFFTFQVSKDSVLLTLHGSPKVSFKGTVNEVIEAALAG